MVSDSTNSSMVVVEMASPALRAWPPQKLCCWYKDYVYVWKTFSQCPNAYGSELPCKLWCVQFTYTLCSMCNNKSELLE
jgi:hypothetical protein